MYSYAVACAWTACGMPVCITYMCSYNNIILSIWSEEQVHAPISPWNSNYIIIIIIINLVKETRVTQKARPADVFPKGTNTHAHTRYIAILQHIRTIQGNYISYIQHTYKKTIVHTT